MKLDNRRSKNQAEQLGIVKTLKVIETQQVNYNEHSTAVIYTDSKIPLNSIKSAKNHKQLVEDVRNRAVISNKKN